MGLSMKLIRAAYLDAAHRKTARAAQAVLGATNREAIDQLLDGIEADDETILLCDPIVTTQSGEAVDVA